MKKILGYLKDYFRNHCNYRFLVALLVFLAIAIYVNYFVISENIWIKADPRPSVRLLKYFVGYLCIFGGAYAIQMIFDRSAELKNSRLWTLILLATLLFSLRAWYTPDSVWIIQNYPPAYFTLVYKLIINSQGFLLLLLPCAVYWLVYDRRREPLYGLHAKGVTLWPYAVLILLMLPLLIAAGSQPDFQQVYPRAAKLNLPRTDPNWLKGVLAYESLYSLDYGVTEFFFRGFLILPFARIAGPKVILPMCAFYLAIHFDKPLGECISSFFGGMILGIIAWRSRSIYGGIIVHLGIALAMEVVGWIYMA
jgi:hypothetical protein